MNRPPTDPEMIHDAVSKVPAITLGFWIIKILATTLGETGGDSVTMSWLGETTASPVPNGYLIGTAIFGVILVGLVWAQIKARNFNPWLYWATIVASTTAGTTLADFATRSLGHRLSRRFDPAAEPGAAFAVRLVPVARHYRCQHRRDGPRPRPFTGSRSPFRRRWARRSATGSRTPGLGYSGGATGVRSGARGARDLSTSRPRISHVCLFWAAFILTRPLGATVGDWLDKPLAKGGLEFSRPLASAVLAAVIVVLILMLPQRAGRRPVSA